jgi:hypothetical protein
MSELLKVDEAFPVTEVTKPILIGVAVAAPLLEPELELVAGVEPRVDGGEVVLVDDLVDELHPATTNPTSASTAIPRVAVSRTDCIFAPPWWNL